MKASGTPLGKYAAVVASIVLSFVIIAAIWGHTLGEPDTLIDAMALVAFGIITGTAGSMTTLNGTVKRTLEQDDEIASLRSAVVQLHQNKQNN